MKITVERITPAIARKFLERNTVNRDLRQNWVETLRLAFQRGEYRFSHQGIAFDEQGQLIDGQHRLFAIAAQADGWSCEMVVTRGLDGETTGNVIDGGIKRTTTDILGLPQRLVEVARFYVKIYYGGASLTPPMIRAACVEIEQAHHMLMTACGAGAKTWSSAPVRAASMLLMMRTPKNLVYVCDQYRALVLQDFDTMASPTRALYKAGVRGDVRAANHHDLFARVWRSFDPSRAKASKVQISDLGGIMDEARQVLGRAVFSELDEAERERQAATMPAPPWEADLPEEPRNATAPSRAAQRPRPRSAQRNARADT